MLLLEPWVLHVHMSLLEPHMYSLGAAVSISQKHVWVLLNLPSVLQRNCNFQVWALSVYFVNLLLP